MPLPLAGQQLHFPPVYPFPTPGPACAVIWECSQDLLLPKTARKHKTKKKKREKNPKSDCSSPPASSKADSNCSGPSTDGLGPRPAPNKTPPFLHLVRILLLGDRGLVLGALGLPLPWALRSFIMLLLSCRSGSAHWCPPAGPPVGCGCGGLWWVACSDDMASHRVTVELHCIALQRIRGAPLCSVDGACNWL